MNTTTAPQQATQTRVIQNIVLGVIGWVVAFAINENLWDTIFYGSSALEGQSVWRDAAHFFVYDSIKIGLLVVGITLVVTFIRTFVSLSATKKLLHRKHQGVGNVIAATVGIGTPFCSCSAVPLFVGFTRAGIPAGVTLSFLIASPLINEVAVGLLWTTFGWKIAAMYIAAGFSIAVVAGFTLGKLGVDRWIDPSLKRPLLSMATGESSAPTLSSRVAESVAEAKDVFRKVLPYLMVGVGLGAFIHGWAPVDFFAEYAQASNPFGVLLAVLIGVPLYSGAAGVMPIVESLYSAGLPMGTLLAFMMAVVGLSLPELILLKQVLHTKLIAIFVGVLAVSISIVGYLFNGILL